MNCHASSFILLALHILSVQCADVVPPEPPEPKYSWDILVFTQRWPLTTCLQWKELSSNNSCALPDPQDLWTIHGIWPTKLGTKGPENCNSSWNFNITAIEPIEAALENYWINIEKNTQLTSLWKHEWQKHGTCATMLPQLNSELAYFKQGLEWIHQFNMKDILVQNQVVPSNKGYTAQQIFNAVKAVLGKNPVIHCVVDHDTKESFISEIQICFNKSLDLVDCTLSRVGRKSRSILTNCSIKKPVMYPNKATPVTTTPPSLQISSTMSTLESLYSTREFLITTYKTFKLLIWATI